MDKGQKDKLEKALKAYTKKVTRTPDAAKAALVKEGIYLKDGKLAPKYKGAAAA